MEHKRLPEAEAATFEADWLEEHHNHLGCGYETGPWSRFLSCTCSEDANFRIEIVDKAYEIAHARRKSGRKVYAY